MGFLEPSFMKRNTLEKIAMSYSKYNTEDTYRAFLSGANFVMGGELMNNIWHFKGFPAHKPNVQIVGLFLVARLAFDIRVVEPEDIPFLKGNGLLAWARMADLIPFESMTGEKM